MTRWNRPASAVLVFAIFLAMLLGAGPLWAGQVSAAEQQPSPSSQQPSPEKQAPQGSHQHVIPASQAPNRAAAYYHFALAQVYQDMAAQYGQPDYATHAIEQYKLALDADPSSKYLNGGLAELYLHTGRVRDAVEAAQNTLKDDPDNLEAHKLLGRVYLQSLGNMQVNDASRKMLQLAIGEYSKIVQLSPNDIESRLLLGQLYTLDHDTLRATEQFQAARKIDPNSEDVVLNLARLYNDSGQTSHAVAVLQSVPENDRTAKIELALGASFEQLNQNDNAIEAYQKAFNLEPDNLDAERSLAQALFSANRLDEALKHFQAIIEADPQDARSYLKIAEIDRQQGHYNRALASLKKARSIAADSVEIRFHEAVINDSLGHYDEAANLLNQLIEQTAQPDGKYSREEQQNRTVFLDRLANVYREQKKTAQAIATYQQMITLGGDSAERGYQGELDTWREAGDYAKATAVAEQAAKAMPANPSVQLMLAAQLADTGQVDRGIALAKAQLKGSPEDREALMALAQIYTRLKRWNDASASLDKAESLASTAQQKVYVDFLRGALAERQKQYDVAEREFRKVLAAEPDSAMTLNYYGYMLAERGANLGDALSMVQHAVRLDPQNGAYLDSLGWVYFKMGQYALAEVNLTRAAERMSNDPTVHDHLGELYARTGRLKQAVAEWESSLSAYSKGLKADAEPGEMSQVQKKLENARVRLAREERKHP